MQAHALLVLLVGVSAAPSLLAHATLLSPRPRTELTLKRGPCGGLPRTSDPLVLEAGSTLDVTWEEYVDHPGFYRLLFSAANDTDFIVLLDQIPDRAIPAGRESISYTSRVTFPTKPCEEATLLLIQVMTENPASPQLYFSCADIKLTAPRLPEVDFRRADANLDGGVDLADAMDTFKVLFLGASGTECTDAADANDDGEVDVSDGITLLLWLFSGGAEPPPPGPSACGPDATLDLLPACTSAAADCQ